MKASSALENAARLPLALWCLLCSTQALLFYLPISSPHMWVGLIPRWLELFIRTKTYSFIVVALFCGFVQTGPGFSTCSWPRTPSERPCWLCFPPACPSATQARWRSPS
ncbi:hypothetical protein ACFL2T_05935 [Elusimicrobiota bacterium]